MRTLPATEFSEFSSARRLRLHKALLNKGVFVNLPFSRLDVVSLLPAVSCGRVVKSITGGRLLTPTFHDTDNDGVGDFRGVTEKIDLLRKIGVTTIYPSPVIEIEKVC
ncbi:unnamed protein product [Nippostrongylus brasiliensis]|uniref:Aamy domain-containing protein n=1 Tax=Nippostrongylus brasiliensis TaxID=27835 RepID=A0A0N4XLD6_NIPBR|nr:unnamed protein product [Nippostrongylus brasiliensis]